MRIMGIDPGSRNTGYGAIESFGNKSVHLLDGVIRVQGDDLGARLGCIYTEVQNLVSEYSPDVVAVETVFLNRNFQSALKLGQARGAAIAAVAMQSVPVVEYSPSEVKQAVVGKGNADKQQVQYMVKTLLNLRETPFSDAADALACALCHSHFSRLNSRMALLTRGTRR